MEFVFNQTKVVKLKEKFTKRGDYSLEKLLNVFMYLWLKKGEFDINDLSEWLGYSKTNTNRIVNDLKDHLDNNMITDEFNLPVYLEKYIKSFIIQFEKNEIKAKWIDFSSNYKKKTKFPNINTAHNIRKLLEEKKDDFYNEIIENKEIHNLNKYFNKEEKSDIQAYWQALIKAKFPMILFFPILLMMEKNEINDDILSAFSVLAYYQYESMFNAYFYNDKYRKELNDSVKKVYKKHINPRAKKRKKF